MGVKHGLSVDGISYFASVIKNKKVPDWMQMGQQIGKLTGHYEILNFLTGYKNMDKFLFTVPKWPIGGMYFDGIRAVSARLSILCRPVSRCPTMPLSSLRRSPSRL